MIDSPPRNHEGPAHLLWHVCGVVLVVLLPTLARLGMPFWELPARLLIQVPALAVGYLGTALGLSLWLRGRTLRSPLLAGAVGAFAFFVSFILLVYLPGFDYSRLVVLTGSALGTVLAVLPYSLQRRGQRLGLAVLLPAVAAVSVWSAGATVGPSQLAVGVATPTDLTATALHNLRIDYHSGLVALSPSSGGGIVPYGDAFIVANGIGDLHWVRSSGEAFSSEPMGLPRPLDRDAFAAEYSEAFEAEHFRIMDLLVDSTSVPHRLLASHYFFDPAERCIAMRVSSIPVPEPGSEVTRGWEPVFTSNPCVAVDQATVTEGLTNHAGGRLAWAPDGTLLFSVGDLSVIGPGGSPVFPQSMDNDYGKILALDPQGRARPFAVGLRNPEGLLVTRDGAIWETEHGPAGGDELNRILPGANYGWPIVSYGTDPGVRTWGLSGATPDHGGFSEPTYSWVPSVGVSNLIEVSGEEFPDWEGDLLVASLNGQSLFRVRTREGRVIYTERIQIGGRLRDLTQDANGRILVWRDDATLVAIANAGEDRTGQIVFAGCAACHEPVGADPALGPDLRNLYGRRVGTQPGFDYSDALTGQDFRWSPERLESFLANPTEYLRGTRMDIPILPPEDRAAVIDYLWGYL